jgi:ubiquinone/menaquinone biosynthesis C-methylase UbiE
MTTEPQIRFEDGAAYERMMGVWSRSAGQIFLDWLAPKPGLSWIDVGCGNGAFTELLVERSAPAAIEGVDPSEAQIAFARKRPAARLAKFQHGDAMALPFADDAFDAAVMALVIFFVPEPAKGVAEMVRVAKPAGSVSAYAWDVMGGGLPFASIVAEMRAMDMTPPLPPRPEASARHDARAVERRRTDRRRDARDRGEPHLRRLRGILDHQPFRLEPRFVHRGQASGRRRPTE